jgi:hypothetical protein
MINNSTPKVRKKSPRTTGAPRAIKATSERLKELWATPEFRERMKQRDQARIAAAKHNPTRFSRYGIPDGMRRAEAERLWARANELADRFIATLKQTGEIPDKDHTAVATQDGSIYVPVTDEGMAEAALREAFVLAVGPSTPQVKSQAINTVLRFTKAKPESKAKLRRGEAEDFLREIMNRED